jgi:site-specific DNA-adenine methylase
MQPIAIPYMGSKRRLAPKIVSTILSRHPNTKYVYDLFGGGAAVTLAFAQELQIKHVFYNDINTGIVELLKLFLSGQYPESLYQWVSREEYHKHKRDKTWFGGLCQTIWSFGNNQRTYLYGETIEQYKQLLHEIVIDGIDRTKEISAIIKHPITMPDGDTYYERKLSLRKQISKFCKDKQYIQTQHLERLNTLSKIPQFTNIEIYNKSYEEVVIDTPIDETIIYLDPPYYKTGKYQFDIDHEKLWEYVASSPYTIYLSSYEAPFPQVTEYEHYTHFKDEFLKRTERLFCNKQ